MKGRGRKRKKTQNRKIRWKMKLHILLQVLVLGALFFYVRYWGSVLDYANIVQELRDEAGALVESASEESFGVGRQTSIGSMAYAEDGTVIAIWRNERDSSYVPISDMPQAVIDAMICTEDRRFYEHPGVDPWGLLRAFFSLVENNGEITQGGSTITMQLARNIYLSQEVTWQRKVEEIFVAIALEDKFSKDQIMEYYLNNIYFGNGYYGIGNASLGYFGKSVKELNLAQLIYLCAIPNSPNLYNPLTNSENTDKRKLRILDQMLEDGYITQEEFAEAVSVEIVLKEPETVDKNDYVDTYATYCAVRALMELSGFTFQYDFSDNDKRQTYEAEYAKCYTDCQQLLYTQGYEIYTSLNLDTQRKLQESVDRMLSSFTETNEEGVYTLQGAAVCIDNDTGQVSAIVGGRSQDFDFYPLNRGYQSFRQPGSSIKPLIVYTPLFERNYTPDTMVMDEPIKDGPRNATGFYSGRITIRYAIEQSINTIAWKLFDELTPEIGISYLTEMEFSQIVPEDYDLPAALGGFTVGVSPLEMAAAYAAIENDGIFRSPTCITRILDADGRVVYEADTTGRRVYTQDAADTMEDALVDVMQYGTGMPVRLNIFCAGKTGTTNDWKDSWFVGYTRRYTTSVWVGYDIPKEIKGLSGPAYSGYIWKDFMEAAN